MKIIITEEQYDRVFNQTSMLWIKRRYSIVKKCLDETFEFTRDRVCRIDFVEFEDYFFNVMMDCLHPYYYDDDSFDYEGLYSILMDIFYVECTEFYFSEREKC